MNAGAQNGVRLLNNRFLKRGLEGPMGLEGTCFHLKMRKKAFLGWELVAGFFWNGRNDAVNSSH